MELFIRIKDGQPFEHPLIADNFFAVFPHVDPNNLPPEFAKFERVPLPDVTVYEVYEGTTYEWFDGIVKDVHHVRDMTEEEKINTQNRAKEIWQQDGGFASWIFNEETCSFDSPVPYPSDGNSYAWNEESLSWVIYEETD